MRALRAKQHVGLFTLTSCFRLFCFGLTSRQILLANLQILGLSFCRYSKRHRYPLEVERTSVSFGALAPAHYKNRALSRDRAFLDRSPELKEHVCALIRFVQPLQNQPIRPALMVAC